MISLAASDSLLRHRPLMLYLGARTFSRFASQIAAVAVGWQVYDMTSSAFALGMIGLVQFIPPPCWCSSPAMRSIISTASGWCSSARLSKG